MSMAPAVKCALKQARLVGGSTSEGRNRLADPMQTCKSFDPFKTRESTSCSSSVEVRYHENED